MAMLHGRRQARVGTAALLLLSATAGGLTASIAATDTPAAAARLTLDRLFAAPAIDGTAPSAPVWSPDSRHVAFRWNADAGAERQLWVAAADGSALRHLAVGPADAGGSVSDVLWLDDDGDHLAVLRDDTLWRVARDGSGAEALAKVGPGASALTSSPTGSHLAWLRDGDLWLLDLATRDLTRATDLGLPTLATNPAGRYARPEREIGPGIWSGPTYAWAPDGRHIAVHVVDRRQMRRVPFPDYLAEETAPNPVRRGYPGDANESRTVALLDVASGRLDPLDLEQPTARRIVDFAWSAQGTLLIDVASDTNVDRWLYTVDPATREPRQIWHSHRPERIYTAFASAWHPDGRHVVFLSDREDRYGLYLVDTSGSGEAVRLTDPAWDVLSGPQVVPASGEVFFTANSAGPAEQHVHRLVLGGAAGGGSGMRLTGRPGRHEGWPSPDGRHLIVRFSDDTTPPELYAVDTAAGSVARITRSPPAEFAEYPWVAARYVQFPSLIDDRTLHARLLLPPQFDPAKRYPVVFGPVYSNTVRNRWAGRYGLVQQLLAQQDYVVVQVDVRGSTGYGRAFREAFLADFAGDDLEDLASAAAWLRAQPWVDPQRFGLWGSSYGGTLTVYTLLTKPGLFCAGAAAAAAVDPFFFGTDDVAIVRRPETHPDIFERAARRYAGNLEDHLLLIHGMQDHVVPFKTTAVLAEALIAAGKDFDFAFAPGATHGWSREQPYARYLFGKLVAHFDRWLRDTPEGCGGVATTAGPAAATGRADTTGRPGAAGPARAAAPDVR